MIGRINGILIEKKPPQLVVDCNGVGYELEASMTTCWSLPEINERVSLFTHLAIRDDAAFAFEARAALGLGFTGKLCIHPAQVAIANEVFTPTPAQIARARRVVDASLKAERAGRGVFALDGTMIDAPVVKLQQRLLERARRAGVLHGDGGDSYGGASIRS